MLSEQQKEYAIEAMTGKKPKFHKGHYGKRYDYYTCGNCGAITKDIIDNYCWDCGFRILWDNPRCLTGTDDPENVTDKNVGNMDDRGSQGRDHAC